MSAATYFSLLVAITLISSGCMTADLGRMLPRRTLAKGSVSGITTSIWEVVKNQAEWEKLWKAHSPVVEPESAAPRVDFNREMVVVATMGRRSTAGYEIEITRIKERDSRLVVFVKSTLPPADAILAQQLTSPFHMIAVSKTELPLEFVEIEQIAKE